VMSSSKYVNGFLYLCKQGTRRGTILQMFPSVITYVSVCGLLYNIVSISDYILQRAIAGRIMSNELVSI
jgi:hypothetical protein